MKVKNETLKKLTSKEMQELGLKSVVAIEEDKIVKVIYTEYDGWFSIIMKDGKVIQMMECKNRKLKKNAICLDCFRFDIEAKLEIVKNGGALKRIIVAN